MTSLYDQARELFTPELMHRMEGYFSATPVMLERAVRAAISALIGAAIDRASTEDGATELLTRLQQSAPTVPADLRAAVKQGEPIAAYLLGSRLASAADLVATTSNVPSS